MYLWISNKIRDAQVCFERVVPRSLCTEDRKDNPDCFAFHYRSDVQSEGKTDRYHSDGCTDNRCSTIGLLPRNVPYHIRCDRKDGDRLQKVLYSVLHSSEQQF